MWWRNNFRLLVLGAGRGGTSLMGSLLDAHPQLWVGLEEQVMAQLLAPQGNLDQRLRAFNKACRKLALPVYPHSWGNKITTEQLDLALRDEGAAGRERLYRKLIRSKKVIFILRDGRSCVQAKLNRTRLSEKQAVENYRQSVVWYRYLQQKHGKDLCSVRFEDLVLKPKEELSKLCEFLGLAYDQQMLKGPQTNRMGEQYRQAKIDPQKALMPKEALRFTALLEEELRYLDYDLDIK